MRGGGGGGVLITLKLGWGHDAHNCKAIVLVKQLKYLKPQKSQQILTLTFGPEFLGRNFLI
jgi:hypothetical protein